MRLKIVLISLATLAAAAALSGAVQAVTKAPAAKTKTSSQASASKTAAKPKAAAKATAKNTAAGKTTTAKKKTVAKKPAASVARRKTRIRQSPWDVPTFADSTIGDNIDGEDLIVRRAAVEALGGYNGSVVVVNASTGRVLSMVNQRLATGGAYQPCSTIKLPVAMGALIEGIIDRDTELRVSQKKRLNLTEALARSDNPFFASLGTKLGFDRFYQYARMFGLGERAGLDIPGEEPGLLPDSPKGFGVGLMSSYGEGIALTPLQLAALVSALANGGTLYYLQYPRSLQEVMEFTPKVKRAIDIEPWLSEITPGMMAAVEYGTARRANHDLGAPILGKTGTCTDRRTHLGWFGSFSQIGDQKLVVVVLLTGGRGVSGPAAAAIAGETYRRLARAEYLAHAPVFRPTPPFAAEACCSQ